MSDVSKLSSVGIAFIALIVSYGALFVAALWMGWMAEEWFWKLTLTYGVVLVILAGVYLIKREFIADEQLKKDKFMD